MEKSSYMACCFLKYAHPFTRLFCRSFPEARTDESSTKVVQVTFTATSDWHELPHVQVPRFHYSLSHIIVSTK